MIFLFLCPECNETISKKSPIGRIPTMPKHCGKRCKRLYQPIPASIEWSRAEYIERAARGEESVPGLTQQEVKSLVDNSFTKQS